MEVFLLTILINLTMCGSVNNYVLKPEVSMVSPREFPFADFFSTSDKLWIDFAKRSYSCEKTTSLTRCCSCAKDCMMYGICCIDKLWKPIVHSNLTSYLLMYKRRFEKADMNLECRQVHPPLNGLGSYPTQSYMMVSSCPAPANAKERIPCEEKPNNAILLPVLGEDGFLYRNSLCARCNFVSAFKFMNLTVRCDSENETVEITFAESPLINLTNCRALLKVPQKTKTRFCLQNNIAKSESQPRKFTGLCKAYKAPFAGYKNYHCTKTESADFFTNHPSKAGCKSRLTWKPGTRWSVQINYFHTDLGPEIHADKIIVETKMNQSIAVNICQHGMEYQGLEKSHCSSLSCPLGYDYINQKCVRLDSAFNRPYGHHVHKCFYSNSQSIFLVHQKTSNTSTIKVLMESLLNQSISDNFDNTGKLVLNFTTDISELLLGKLTRAFSVVKPLLDEIEEIVINPHSNYFKLYEPEKEKWTNITKYPDGRICEHTFPIDPLVINVSQSCHVNMGGNTRTNHIIPLSELFYNVIIDKNNTSLYINGCKKFLSKSSCIRRDLFAPDQQEMIMQHGYIFCELKTNKQKIWTRIVDMIDGYVTFVGTVVSIVCHTLSLTTFKLFPKTLPFGLVCLCISFLFSDTLYVVVRGLHATKTQVETELCKSLAIGVHLSAMVVQSCSVVSAVDIATKFGVLKPSQQRGPLGRYVYRRVPALISLSLTLVVIAFTLDHLDIVDMGYGERGMCLFSGYYGRLLFYITPNSVSLIFVLSLVIFTLHRINKQNKQSNSSFNMSTASNRPTVNVARISLNLVLAYGVSELIGFVQFPWDDGAALAINTVFALLYDISRSLRGVIIFVVYICKPQVFRLCVQQFHVHWRDGKMRPAANSTCQRRTGGRESNGEMRVRSKNTTNREIGFKNQSYKNDEHKCNESAMVSLEQVAISSSPIMKNIEVGPTNSNVGNGKSTECLKLSDIDGCSTNLAPELDI